MSNRFLLAVTVALVVAGCAPAEVADSSAAGFTLKSSFTIQATPDQVYSRLLRVGDWWDSAHTYSQDAHNLTLEEKPMGCFCEKLRKGAVRHMEVVFFAPGQRLVLVGGLGPLQSLAATGSLTIVLGGAEAATHLDVTYAVGGYLAAGLNTLAGPVDAVLYQQFTRLKNYVEKGDPAPK